MITLEKLKSSDGSIKILWESGKARFESGAYPLKEKQYSFCISTQSGCKQGCKICALTTINQDTISRNLNQEELEKQMWGLAEYLHEQIEGASFHSIGYVGMGEPLQNYDNLVEHIRSSSFLNKFKTLPRTISTVGIPDRIKRLEKEKFSRGFPRLQLSVHKVIHRETLIPLEKKYPLSECIWAASSYAIRSGLRVRANYLLLEGVNDSKKEITRLAEILDPRFFEIFLPSYAPPVANNKFRGVCDDKKQSLTALIHRVSAKKFGVPIEIIQFPLLGLDIKAGCGQLTGSLN